MPELFPCDLIVVRRAEAADVVVDVFAALGERDDMVGHGGCGHPAFGLAHAAQWLGGEAALAERDALAAPDALSHCPCASDALRSAARDHDAGRSEEHTSELQSLMRISYAVFCLKKKKRNTRIIYIHT